MKRTTLGTWIFIEILLIYEAAHGAKSAGIAAVINIGLLVLTLASGILDELDFDLGGEEKRQKRALKITNTLSYYMKEVQDPYSERRYYRNMEDLCLMLYTNRYENYNNRLLGTIKNQSGEYYTLESARTILKTCVAKKLSETNMGETLSEKDKKRLLHTQNIIITENEANEKSSLDKYYV